MMSKESPTLEELEEIMKDIPPLEEVVCITTPEQIELFKELFPPPEKLKGTLSSIYGIPIIVSEFIPEGKFALVPQE